VFASVYWQETEFTIVDTGGMEPKPESSISQGIIEQVQIAIADADVIIFLVDVKDGVTTLDQDIADMLRQMSKPVLLVVNKADNTMLEAEAIEFYELSIGEPHVISAYHGRGTIELLDKIVAILPPTLPEKPGSEAIKVAIVGRPNVGKSMLLNVLLGKERSLVNETPGTTRDAVDTLFDFEGQNMLIIDTAGIRRRGRLEPGIERYSVIRALRAIERADIALLVIDASEPFTAQDVHIGGYVRQMAKGIILIINKWDLVTEKNKLEWDSYIRSQFKFMPYAPNIYTSAKFGQGIDGIIPKVCQIFQERLKRLPTAAVNNVVQKALADHSPPRTGKKRLKILYATQAEVNPPTFVFFVNDTKLIHFSYQRYLENKLRQSFGFEGTPLRLVFKTKGES